MINLFIHLFIHPLIHSFIHPFVNNSLVSKPESYYYHPDNRVAVLNKHQRAVSGCVCDGAGRVLVSVGLDARALLWHGATGDFEGTLARENSAINCVTMHPEARLVVSMLLLYVVKNYGW